MRYIESSGEQIQLWLNIFSGSTTGCWLGGKSRPNQIRYSNTEVFEYSVIVKTEKKRGEKEKEKRTER